MKMVESNKIRLTGAANDFIAQKLAQGIVSFSLPELTVATGLSTIAAKNQLYRLGDLVTRVTQRQQYFLIVTPEHRAIGAPPVEYWLDDYFAWLKRPYYLALQSAAAVFGSSQQAVQETQVMTSAPIREMLIGRIRLRFFAKSGIKNTITQKTPNAYAPLAISTPAATLFDLIRYAASIGGIERVAETIAPMVPLIKATALRQVMNAEQELATTQRLGFVLDGIQADALAKVVYDWLPSGLKIVPISTHTADDRQALISKKWAIRNNSNSFQ